MTSTFTLLLLGICMLLLQRQPVTCIPLNLPSTEQDRNTIDNNSVVPEGSASSGSSTSSPLDGPTAHPDGNCSNLEAISDPISQTSNKTSNNSLERKQELLDAIRLQILAKFRLTGAPRNTFNGSDIVVPSSVISTYYAHVEAQNRNVGETRECSSEKTTHFSRHLKLFYPNSSVSAPMPATRYALDSKANILKDNDEEDPSKMGKLTKDEDEKSPPMILNLQFDEFDFASNQLWLVQLQLYSKKASVVATNNKRGVNFPESVKVYQVIRKLISGTLTKKYMLLAVKNVPSDSEGYVSFNITSGIKNWLKSDPKHLGLELEVVIDTPEMVDSGLLFPPAITFDVPEHKARLLVEVLNEKENLDSHRKKRQTIEGINSEYCFNNPSEENCCIRSLTVNFKEDLGIDWIMHPKVYTFNYCNGQCRDPDWSAATRSTEFLIKIRENNPTAAAEPCCVAHDTVSMPLVVVNPEGRVEVMLISDMIVNSCICR